MNLLLLKDLTENQWEAIAAARENPFSDFVTDEIPLSFAVLKDPDGLIKRAREMPFFEDCPDLEKTFAADTHPICSLFYNMPIAKARARRGLCKVSLKLEFHRDCAKLPAPMFTVRVGALPTWYVSHKAFRNRTRETHEFLIAATQVNAEGESAREALRQNDTMKALPVNEVAIIHNGLSAYDPLATGHASSSTSEGGDHSGLFQAVGEGWSKIPYDTNPVRRMAPVPTTLARSLTFI